MPLTLSTQDAVLKEWYEGTIRETLNNEVPMFKMLESSDKSWSGRRVIFPIHTSRNSGVGSRAESGTLPTAGNQGHVQSVVSATYFYARARLTGQSIAAGKHAFAEALAMEMEGLTKDARNDLGRQTWGDGTGRLAQVGAAAASASSISLFNRFYTGAPMLGHPGARYINEGSFYAFGTVASPNAQHSGNKVEAVSVSQNPATTTDTITVSATMTASASDTFVFVAGSGGSGSELNGVMALVDVYSQSNWWGSNGFAGATVQGISRATNSRWNANVLANSGVARIVDGDLMQQAFDRVDEESGGDVDFISGHHSVIRAFLESVSGDRRYNTASFDAGMSALTYNGVPLVKDRQAPYNTLTLFAGKALKLFTLLPIEFADLDGSILSRVSDSDSWECFLRSYLNVGLDDSPRKTLQIRDIRTEL